MIIFAYYMMFFIFMLLIFRIETTQSFPTVNYTKWDCLNSSTYQLHSSFETNLNRLLSTLDSQISKTEHGFFIKFEQGSEADQDHAAYGLAMCHAGIKPEDCRDCVKMARKAVVVSCPRARKAVLWKDKCMLRYSDESFDSLHNQQPKRIIYNFNNVTEYVDGWTKLLEDTLIDVTSKAASEGSALNKFATKEAWFSPTRRYLQSKSSAPPPVIARTNQGKKKGSVTKLVGKIVLPLAVLGLLIGVGTCLFRRIARSDDFRTLIFISRNSAREIDVDRIEDSVAVSKRSAKVPFRHSSSDLDVRNVLNDLTTAEALMFELRSLEAATNNFSDDQKLGEGGFGIVYKGTLPNGQEIAVKRLSKISGQGVEEFKNEVLVIAKLQHRNLVRLLGFCLAGDEKLLVYEFVPNKSLNYFLFDEGKQAELNWPIRYEIIRGIARGLLYLHVDSRPRIIHRDLKSGNILLDADMNPKISDFGLARIFKVGQIDDDTSRVVGTYGYMAPEYAMHGQFSEKSDVYSFGVLVLEIVSGKKINARFHSSEDDDLLTYAWKSLNEENPLEFMDPTLRDTYSKDEVTRCIHLGLLCAQENTMERPAMSKVAFVLNADSTNDALPTPQCPRSFYFGSTESSLVSSLGLRSTITTSTNESMPSSNNQDAIIEIYHPR